MNTIFKKLNYKNQESIFIANAPESFKNEMKAMAKVAAIKTDWKGARSIDFFMGFVTRQSEVDSIAKSVGPLMSEDGLLWLCYPKGTSKKYTCEFNRDTGWTELGKAGYEPVRMVAVDEDWSALRFRRVEKIKKMTRSFAMTEAGKKKVAATRKVKKK